MVLREVWNLCTKVGGEVKILGFYNNEQTNEYLQWVKPIDICK